MGLLEQIESKAFLGEEFLTWVVWRSETRNGLIGVDDLEVQVGEGVVLRAPFGDAEEVALKGENPAASHELGTALCEGKLIARVQLRWVIDGAEWHVTVRGDTLALSGLALPLRSGPADAAWIERRLELLDGFGEAFDRVYQAFLAIRLSDRAWKREVEAMREWVSSNHGGSASAPDVIEITDEEN